MGKSAFKPGNMLYPLPAVMVSCQYPGASDPKCGNPALAGRPNILTVAWAGTVCTNPALPIAPAHPQHRIADALHLRSSGALLLPHDRDRR